ncbi:MAG TPA: hypothetical protein VF421_16230 [Niabella sp.]
MQPEKKEVYKRTCSFCYYCRIKRKVDALTERFRSDGFPIAGIPRTSEDGYYERIILESEGNVAALIA